MATIPGIFIRKSVCRSLDPCLDVGLRRILKFADERLILLLDINHLLENLAWLFVDKAVSCEIAGLPEHSYPILGRHTEGEELLNGISALDLLGLHSGEQEHLLDGGLTSHQDA